MTLGTQHIRNLERIRLAWLGPLFLAKQFGVIRAYVTDDRLMVSIATWLTAHSGGGGGVIIGSEKYACWVDALCPTGMTAVDVAQRCKTDRDFSSQMIDVARDWQSWVSSGEQQSRACGWSLVDPGAGVAISGPELDQQWVDAYIAFSTALGPAAGLCHQWTWLAGEVDQRM